MQVQKINNNTNFGLYDRGLLDPAHAKLLDALHPRLSKIGKKVNLLIRSSNGVAERGSDYIITMPCLNILAWRKDSFVPITHSADVFLKSKDPKQEIMDAAYKVSLDALRPHPRVLERKSFMF